MVFKIGHRGGYRLSTKILALGNDLRFRIGYGHLHPFAVSVRAIAMCTPHLPSLALLGIRIRDDLQGAEIVEQGGALFKHVVANRYAEILSVAALAKNVRCLAVNKKPLGKIAHQRFVIEIFCLPCIKEGNAGLGGGKGNAEAADAFRKQRLRAAVIKRIVADLNANGAAFCRDFRHGLQALFSAAWSLPKASSSKGRSKYCCAKYIEPTQP